MTTSLFRRNAATLIPLICAVHCLAAPALVLISPAFGENPLIEFGALGLALAFGIPAVRAGWCEHGNRRPLILAGVGILIWSTSLLGLVPLEPVGLVHAAGAVLTGAGLLWNASARRSCSCAVHHEIDHPVEADPATG